MYRDRFTPSNDVSIRNRQGFSLLATITKWLCLIPLFSQCSSTPNYDDGSVLYQQSQHFDKFVHEKLSPSQVTELKHECASRPSSNPFCFSVKNSRYLFKRKKQKQARSVRPKKAAPPKPANIRFTKKGALRDVWTLRRTSVGKLLAALKTLPQDKLLRIARTTLKQKCPNHLAAATGATLEDYLPNKSLNTTIAKLYAKAGRCAKRRSRNREHFYTRAGLFYYLGGNYKEAKLWFARSVPRDAFSGRSVYWLYRSQKELGQDGAAKKTFSRLINQYPFSFHAMVASLQQRFDIASEFPSQETPWASRSKRTPTVNHIIKQMEILNKYGFFETAGVLGVWALRSYRRMEPKVRLYVAKLGDPHTKVTTIPLLLLYHSRLISEPSLKLNYPKAYFDLIDGHNSGVDPYLLLALARKESQFDPNAVSQSNAQGLLQLNPKTAARISSSSDLLDIKTNIQIGAKYLSSLMDRYDNHHFMALAAYNAGEKAADKWRRRYPNDDPVLFVDLLSYRETRNYVGFVLNNYYWYRRLWQNDRPSAVSKRLSLD